MSVPLRLAYLSPLPPARSGIADYSEELLSALDPLTPVTLFAPAADRVRLTWLDRPVAPLADFPPRRGEFDLAIYHLGNNADHHDELYDLAGRYPGLLVLHDYNLHQFVAHRTLDRQRDFAAYARELAYELGPAGFGLALRLAAGTAESPVDRLPLNGRIIDRSLGLLVHSEYVRGLVRGRFPQKPVWVTPQPLARPEPASGAPPLALPLASPDQGLRFASLGQRLANRQLPLALRAFARLRREGIAAHYLLLGAGEGDGFDLVALLRDLAIEADVTVTGYLPERADFLRAVQAADVIVNLRHPTLGETSAAALRGLAAGRPLIVFDQGWYAELPPEVALRVPVLDETALVAAMRRLAQDPLLRQAMGRSAAEYAAVTHDPARVARRYLDVCRALLAARRPLPGAHAG